MIQLITPVANVIIIHAIVADINLTTAVVSQVHILPAVIFAALLTLLVILGETAVTNISTVDVIHAIIRVIFAADIAVGVVLIAATLANPNPLAARVANIEQLLLVFLAIVTHLRVPVFRVAILAVNAVTGFAAAHYAKPPGSNIERVRILVKINSGADVSVKVRVGPVVIPAKALSDANQIAPISGGRGGFPQVRDIFEGGDFTLNQIAVQFGIFRSSVNASRRVVHPALQKQSAAGAIRKNLPRGLAVIKRFCIRRVCYGENDEANIVPSISGAAVVVLILGRVKRVAARERASAIIAFRIAHRDEMRRVDADEHLEPNLLGVQLIRELCE